MCVGEIDASTGKSIQVGGKRLGVTPKKAGPIVHVVDCDEQNIGSRVFGLQAGGHQQGRNEKRHRRDQGSLHGSKCFDKRGIPMRIKDGYSQFWMMLSQESVDRLTQPRYSTRTAPSFRECHERVLYFCGNALTAPIETINLHPFVEYRRWTFLRRTRIRFFS